LSDSKLRKKNVRSIKEENLTLEFEKLLVNHKVKNDSTNFDLGPYKNIIESLSINDKICVLTHAGIIVEVVITDFLSFYFEGIVSKSDEERLIQAGCRQEKEDVKSTFYYHQIKDRSEYECELKQENLFAKKVKKRPVHLS